MRFAALPVLALVALPAAACLGGCGRKGPPSPASPASPSSSAAPSAEPQKRLADAAAALYDIFAEIESQELAVRTWNEQHYNESSPEHRQRMDFQQRFHELMDAEFGEKGFFGRDEHLGLLRTIAEKHLPALAPRLDDGDFTRHLSGEVVCQPSYGFNAVSRCQRGDGKAPPAPDKARACADYVDGFVRGYVSAVLKRRQLVEGGIKAAGLEFEAACQACTGVTLSSWFGGNGPRDLDLLAAIQAAMGKHHPDKAEKTMQLIRGRTTQWIQHAQKEVKENLVEIRMAEQRFRALDLDNNGVADFWTADVSGLARVVVEGEPLRLVSGAVAQADGAPLPEGGILGPPCPKPDWSLESDPSLFGFQMVKLDADGRPLAQDTDASGRAWRNPGRFAVCAFPLGYGRVGRQTYLMDETGRIRFKDTDGKAVERLPKDYAAEGWAEVEGEKFGAVAADLTANLPAFVHAGRLKDPDPEVRARAARELGSMPGPSRTSRKGVRVEAQQGSGVFVAENIRTLTPAALQALAGALADPEASVREAAAEALERVGRDAAPFAAPAVERALQDGRPDDVPRACNLVRTLRLRGGAIPAALARAAGNADPNARRQALEALSEMPLDAGLAESLRPVAVKALDSPESAVGALRLLGALGPRAAADAAIVEKGLAHEDPQIQLEAAIALFYIQDRPEPAVTKLAEALKSPPDDDRVLGRLYDALSALGPRARKAEPAVRARLEANYLVERAEAAYALCRITGQAEPAVAALLRLLDEGNIVSVRAAEKLGRIGPPAARAVPALTKRADPDERNAEVQEAAAAALARIRGPAAGAPSK